ncbi:hypothetical protein LTR10_002620 [Elasticomyces elasticus]|nr:hypothetical protein LTR10_002620 [Elasticomyces elasticus]KAK4968036.1 hypothetical protein LTR42_010366 [Elasticomyces elasticus]
MNAMQPVETSLKLIDAAAATGVRYIVPNELVSKREQVQLGKDLMLAEGQIKVCEHIMSKHLKQIGVGCDFWYEHSLAGTETRFGFDFAKRTVTFYDEGDTKITTSTWTQTGRALAHVLALPLTSEAGLSIAQLENSQVLITSHYVSQRKMLDSILRVTGYQESQWTISHDGAKARFGRGMSMMQQGNFHGFEIAIYSRAFFPDDSMNHEAKVMNAVLDLPKEDLDASTRTAISMAGQS